MAPKPAGPHSGGVDLAASIELDAGEVGGEVSHAVTVGVASGNFREA
jgi:hypothetical protein